MFSIPIEVLKEKKYRLTIKTNTKIISSIISLKNANIKLKKTNDIKVIYLVDLTDNSIVYYNNFDYNCKNIFIKQKKIEKIEETNEIKQTKNIIEKVEKVVKHELLKPLVRNNARILIIVDYIYMINNLAENRYKIIQYWEKHNKDVITTGTGRKGFQTGMSIFKLVAQLGIKPEIIIHANNFTHEKLIVSDLHKYPCKKVLIIEDMHTTGQITKLIKNNGIHYILYHYDNQQCDTLKMLNNQSRFIYYPHFVDTNIFKNWGQTKTHDIILYGCPNPSVYPFRYRLFMLIRKCKLFKVLNIDFPGYFIQNKKQSIVTGVKLSKAINKAYIGISTTSNVDYFVKKYLEIPASYTMIAGNLPLRSSNLFKDKIIELHPNMSDTTIIRTLQEVLSDKKKLLEKTDILHKYIVQNFSYEKSLESFNKIMDKL